MRVGLKLFREKGECYDLWKEGRVNISQGGDFRSWVVVVLKPIWWVYSIPLVTFEEFAICRCVAGEAALVKSRDLKALIEVLREFVATSMTQFDFLSIRRADRKLFVQRNLGRQIVSTVGINLFKDWLKCDIEIIFGSG